MQKCKTNMKTAGLESPKIDSRTNDVTKLKEQLEISRRIIERQTSKIRLLANSADFYMNLYSGSLKVIYSQASSIFSLVEQLYEKAPTEKRINDNLHPV